MTDCDREDDSVSIDLELLDEVEMRPDDVEVDPGTPAAKRATREFEAESVDTEKYR